MIGVSKPASGAGPTASSSTPLIRVRLRVQRRGRLVGHRGVLTLVIVPARLRAGGRRAGRRQVDPADRRGPAGWWRRRSLRRPTQLARSPDPARARHRTRPPRAVAAHRTPAHHHDRGGRIHRPDATPDHLGAAGTEPGEHRPCGVQLGRRRVALEREQHGRRAGAAAAHQPASRSSGATARAVTTSAPPSARRTAGSSARPRSDGDVRQPRAGPDASSRNAARRASGSSSVSARSGAGERRAGSRAGRRRCRRRPTRAPAGISSATTAELSRCRSHSRGTSRGPIRPRTVPSVASSCAYATARSRAPPKTSAAPAAAPAARPSDHCPQRTPLVMRSEVDGQAAGIRGTSVRQDDDPTVRLLALGLAADAVDRRRPRRARPCARTGSSRPAGPGCRSSSPRRPRLRAMSARPVRRRAR